MCHLRPALSILFVILLLSSGCAKRKETLSPDDVKLVPVYAGLVMLSEEYKASASQPDTAVYQHQVDSLLANNGLTRDEFSNRLKLLAQSPLAYQQFTEMVRKDLEHRKSR
jgi:hypothetical protein